jgi:RNA-directed DNA polymerase
VKTYKHLYPQITAFENLYQAFKNAARGKRSHPDVAGFEFDLEGNLLVLQAELQTLAYAPGPYTNFRIHDPKPRLISAAPFRDRVVHHALCQVIEPLFERRFIFDSYACRVGKGTHAALNRAQQFSRRYPYVLQCDLEHFFPNIDHRILRAQLAGVIADPSALWLCEQILDSGAGIHREDVPPRFFPGDDLLAALRPRGLPIGNLTSQFWANIYLNPLDQFVKRDLKCQAYVRYVDDFLLFADDKPTLHAWKQAIVGYVASLRLGLHEQRAAVYPASTGIPFLGWRLYPDHRRLKRRNGVAFQRRFESLRGAYAAGEINRERLEASINGWIAHVAHGDTWGLRRALLSGVVLPKQPWVASQEVS